MFSCWQDESTEISSASPLEEFSPLRSGSVADVPRISSDESTANCDLGGVLRSPKEPAELVLADLGIRLSKLSARSKAKGETARSSSDEAAASRELESGADVGASGESGEPRLPPDEVSGETGLMTGVGYSESTYAFIGENANEKLVEVAD